MRLTRLRSEGNGGASHVISHGSALIFRSFLCPQHVGNRFCFAFFLWRAHAASIRGVVTDASGARVTGATVELISSGQVVGSAVSGADGSFQIMTGQRGRFFLVVSATKFRQLETPGFYAGQLDNIERNLVLEPEWVRESIVVTATGTPTPQPQTGAATSVIGPQELELSDDLVSSLRLMPGTFVVQTGQRGAQSSLFVRGGDSDDNLVLIDGVNAGDLGGRFDFGTSVDDRGGTKRDLSWAEFEPVRRGCRERRGQCDDAARDYELSHRCLFHGDWGNFVNFARRAGLRRVRSASSTTSARTVGCRPPTICRTTSFTWEQRPANFGFQPIGSTQLRGTVHYGVGATGVPGPGSFYQLADNATEKDQDLYIGASIDNQTTADFHNMVRYGATRKREQYSPVGADAERMSSMQCGDSLRRPGDNYRRERLFQ